jgi:hypothetical protein
VYIYIYLTAYRMYMNYRCYQIILRVKHFCTNRERCGGSAGCFITGAPACRLPGEYVTLDKAFYNPRNKPLTQASRETDEHTSAREVAVLL